MKIIVNFLFNFLHCLGIPNLMFVFIRQKVVIKKMILIVGFLLANISFAQNENFYISSQISISGLEHLYAQKETESIKNINTISTPENTSSTGTFFVYNSKTFFAKDAQHLKIVFVQHTSKIKTSKKLLSSKTSKDIQVVTPKTMVMDFFPQKEDSKTTFTAALALVPAPVLTKTKRLLVAKFQLNDNIASIKARKLQNQTIGYNPNNKAYSIAISLCNRPPPAV